MSCLAVIPAKGTSERLPGKNMRLFKGKPLVQWAIECAKECDVFKETIVTSDSIQILDLADKADIIHLRQGHMKCPDIPLAAVVLDALAGVNHEHDEFCLLLPTSPLRTPELLCEIYNTFREQKSPCLMTFHERGGLHDGTAIFCKTEAFLKKPDFYALDPAWYLVPDNLSADINTEEDLAEAESKAGG